MLVNIWESVNPEREAQRFRDIYGIEGTVLIDATASLATRLGVRGVPVNVLVDHDGTVGEVGATTPEELKAAITGLLGHSDWDHD